MSYILLESLWFWELLCGRLHSWVSRMLSLCLKGGYRERSTAHSHTQCFCLGCPWFYFQLWQEEHLVSGLFSHLKSSLSSPICQLAYTTSFLLPAYIISWALNIKFQLSIRYLRIISAEISFLALCYSTLWSCPLTSQYRHFWIWREMWKMQKITVCTTSKTTLIYSGLKSKSKTALYTVRFHKTEFVFLKKSQAQKFSHPSQKMKFQDNPAKWTNERQLLAATWAKDQHQEQEQVVSDTHEKWNILRVAENRN